jgi:hypothetical protein
VKYYLERSEDNRNFKTIDFIRKTNTVSGTAYYSITDENPVPGINFYRLRVEREGQRIFYSNTILLKTGEKSIELQVYPVPFTNHLNAEIELTAADEIKVTIISAAGFLQKEITLKGNKGENKIQLNNLDNLLPGIYLMKVRVNDTIIIKRIMKL